MVINKVFLAGNLTRDVELRFTLTGKALAKATVAVNRKFNVGEEQREEVAFIDVECWGKPAEQMGQFRKGQNVVLEGRLKQDNWEDKETKQKRSKLLVVVDGFPGVVQRTDAPGPETDKPAPEKPEYAKDPDDTDSVPF